MNRDGRLRILVLTSSTGGGHDARAEAFAEWCFLLYRHAVDVRIEHMLERSSQVHRGGVAGYNWMQRRAPWMHSAFYTLVEGLSFLNGRTVTFGRSYYRRVLRRFRPHLIFSVHDCLNRGYFQLARRELRGRVRCATYCGEFAGGWGYSRNWVEPSVDLYLSRTPTAADYAVKALGLDPARSRVRGHLMPPRVWRELLPAEARRDLRVRELGLRPDRLTVFFATGSNGANNHLPLLRALLPHAARVQAVAICGRDTEAYHTLLRWRSEHPGLLLHAEGYSERVHLLLQASDLVVTRGGTTTCAKALHFGCPIVFNRFGGLMPQERLTVKFFQQGAQAPAVGTAEEWRTLVDHWLAEGAVDLEDYRQRFLGLRYAADPAQVIEELVALAAEAAGAEPPVPVVPLWTAGDTGESGGPPHAPGQWERPA